MAKPTILIIEDEVASLHVMADFLTEAGYEVIPISDGVEGLKVVQDNEIDLVLCDFKLPKISGLEFYKRAKKLKSHLPLIMMTAYSSVQSAVEIMKLGASDYLTKPLNYDELRLSVTKVLEQQELLREVRTLRDQVTERYGLGGIIGKSQPLQKVFQVIHAVADTDTTILIKGETGTGKELVAKAIHLHDRSRRKNKPFIAVNCAAFPRDLLESELFGHEKGAFTGAIAQRKGTFELADQGTLFLDEIGTANMAAQAELLRVLQEQKFRRVGGTKTVEVDVRLIAATNEDLVKKIQEGQFRQDLYYRFNVIPIEVPPLRERLDDLPNLIDHFFKKYSGRYHRELKSISSEALQLIYQYPWPGNIRELENLIERLIVTCPEKIITPQWLPLEYQSKQAGEIKSSPEEMLKTNQTLRDLERETIRKVLAQNKGHRGKTAEQLGISRKVLWSKMKEYHLK